MRETKSVLRKLDQILAKIRPRPVVAVVDDNPAAYDLLERTFHDEGFETHHFLQAEDLLKELAAVRPDAVVMEVVLPGMNGISALDELRPKEPEVSLPVVLLAEKDDARAKLLAFRRGAADYVVRPFQTDELAARVRSLVRMKLTQDFLRKSSVSDPVTSLYNRRFLTHWLGAEIARVKRYGLPLSCVAVDVDDFRRVNDELGEDFGDFVLQSFGELMKKNTRNSDIVGRLENDDFVVLLPGTSRDQAVLVARRLRKLTEETTFRLKTKEAHPSLSMGIVTREAPDREVTADSFLDGAQAAVQKAKGIGAGKTAVLSLD